MVEMNTHTHPHDADIDDNEAYPSTTITDADAYRHECMNEDVLDRVDVCVTTISSKPPTLPLREELPSLGVELVYNSKGTGMRGVRRAHLDAKRLPPPPSVKRGSSSHTSKVSNQVKRTVRQTRLGRQILRGGSSGSLSTTGGGGNDAVSATMRISPKTVAVSYEAYQRTALRSPESSVASSYCDQSIGTHSTACTDDDVSLDKIDEGAEEENVQHRREKWEQLEASNPSLADKNDGEQSDEAAASAGLSYNFDSMTSNVQQGQVASADIVTISPPSAEKSSPMQKIEQWSEALRNLCCLGYRNLYRKDPTSSMKKAKNGDEQTAPLLAFSASQDSDMLHPQDKIEEDKTPPVFVENVGLDTGKSEGVDSRYVTVTAEEEVATYENELFALLAHYDTRPEEVKELITANPDLVSTVVEESGRTPLHALCDRGLSLDPWDSLPDVDVDETPPRVGGNANDARPIATKKNTLVDSDSDYSEEEEEEDINARRLINGLLGDITNFRIMLKVVAWADVDACCTKDKDTDLPLHILARRLVEWEKSWNQEDIKYFCDPSDITIAARITTLYRTMAECIEVVLRPVAEKRELCMSGGSCGVLPLHIAALFGTSYDTLNVMEEYIEGAQIPCKVHSSADDDGDSNSSEFEKLPLTLLEQREIEQTHIEEQTEVKPTDSFSVGIQWSSSALGSGPISDDFVRKSDLLFACYPNILPQRKEPARLKRIESMVRSEVMQLHRFGRSYSDSEITVAIESVWLFMCKFTNKDDEDDHYAENVKRIVEGLDSVSLVKLVAITDRGGQELLDVANPKCGAVIKKSLQEAVQNGSASPRCASQGLSVTSGPEGRDEKKSILKNANSSKASKDSKVSNEIGRICKAVFRMKQNDVPTSFIILPYRMKENASGQLALATSKDEGLALKFAQSLVKLTDARSILFTLGKFGSCNYYTHTAPLVI